MRKRGRTILKRKVDKEEDRRCGKEKFFLGGMKIKKIKEEKVEELR